MKSLMFCEQEHGDSILRTWLPAAKEAKRRGWRVSFLCGNLCTDAYLATLTELDMQVIRTAGFTKTVEASWGLSKAMRWLRTLLKHSEILTYIWNFTVFRRALKELFLRHRVSCIVVVLDGFHFRNNIYPATARALGIASICLPTSYGGLPNLFTHTRSFPPGARKLQSKGILDSVARIAFRDRYVFSAFGYQAIPWRAAEHIAGALCGVRPNMPTCRAGGCSDLVLAPSEFARDVLIEEGVDGAKTEVVGSPNFDELTSLAADDGQKADIRAEYGCGPDDVLVVWNMINFSGYGLISEDAERQMIEPIYAHLAAAKNIRLVISMHPGRCGSMFTSLADAYGARFAHTHGVNALIAAADFYVTPISTTMTSAGLLNVPTVVLAYFTEIENPQYVRDHERLKEHHFYVAMNAPEFGTQMGELLDPCRRASIRARMAERSEIWGRLDGGSSQRIVDAIERTSARHSDCLESVSIAAATADTLR